MMTMSTAVETFDSFFRKIFSSIPFSILSLEILTLIVVLLNLKALPLAWHFRLINGLFKHIYLHPPRFTSVTGPPALFQPMKIASRVTLLDCDYNIHKSNATYFADFDIARLHLLTCLLKSGMKKTGKELGGRIGIHLGGAACNFKKEIKPYQGFEIWSRVLAWDRKWIYTISHFVEKGSVRPRGWTLQPWRKVNLPKKKRTAEKSGLNSAGDNKNLANGAAANVDAHPPARAIFASAIAKYVFKHGRLTIPPERILQNSNLLPPKPEFLPNPPLAESPSPTVDTTSTEEVNVSAISVTDLPPSSLFPKKNDTSKREKSSCNSDDGEWTWDRIEQERQRGMKVAELYAGLEALNQELKVEGEWVLGEFGDLL